MKRAFQFVKLRPVGQGHSADPQDITSRAFTGFLRVGGHANQFVHGVQVIADICGNKSKAAVDGMNVAVDEAWKQCFSAQVHAFCALSGGL